MGYKPPEQTYRILFGDEDMSGFELVVRSASTAKILEIAKMKLTIADASAVRSVYTYFASRIVSWNLVDDSDKVLPITVTSLLKQEPAWVAKVISGWLRAVGTGIKPTAPATAVVNESDIPMEVMS